MEDVTVLKNQRTFLMSSLKRRSSTPDDYETEYEGFKSAVREVCLSRGRIRSRRVTKLVHGTNCSSRFRFGELNKFTVGDRSSRLRSNGASATGVFVGLRATGSSLQPPPPCPELIRRAWNQNLFTFVRTEVSWPNFLDDADHGLELHYSGNSGACSMNSIRIHTQIRLGEV